MLDEKLSALIDGELESSEADRVLTQIKYDVRARATWERMCLARAAICCESPFLVRSEFTDEVLGRLDSIDPEPQQARHLKVIPLRRRWNRSIAGFAVAASVAVAVVLVLEQPAANDGTKVASSTPVPAAAQESTVADNSSSKATHAQVHTASAKHSTGEAAASQSAHETHTTGSADNGFRVYVKFRGGKMAKPGQVLEQDTVRASRSNWSRLIAPYSSDGSQAHPTGNGTWQFRRSAAAGQLQASNDDHLQNSGHTIGFLRLPKQQGDNAAGQAQVAVNGASN